MKYKGKNVTWHRYRQLKKTNENWHKFLDKIWPKAYVTNEEYKRLFEFLKEGE
jgi:hypothetical protein